MISSARLRGKAVTAAAMLLCLPWTARATTRILVPAYFDPNDSNDWNVMTASVSAAVPITAIMNPDNGPVGSVDAGYTSAIAALEGAGGNVVGYIETGYGSDPIATVKSQVDLYKSEYPNLNGIFVDEMDNTSANLDYYKSLYSYIKSQNASWQVIGNPGVSTLESYLSPTPAAADELMTFENDTGYSSYVPPSWQSKYSPTSFANIVYALASATTMQADLAQAVTDRAGNVFITDLGSNNSNPYAQLPSYWSTEVATVSAENAIIVTAGQTYHFAANPNSGILVEPLVSLTVNATGKAVLNAAANHSNRQILILSNGLTLAGSTASWTGVLDLANNDLDLAGASLPVVTNQLRQGFAGGTWNGTGGIISSAAATSARLYALGVMQNNQSGIALYTSGNLFDGVTPGISDVLVKFTYYGDANLDGKVDGSDYTHIDASLLAEKTGGFISGWFNGDFNYDGIVNGSDYTLIDNAYNAQSASLAALTASASITAQIATTVPEPAIVGLAASIGILGWRRRRWALCPSVGGNRSG